MNLNDQISQNDKSNNDKKRCNTCHEEIQSRAIKCIHCGSFQDLRRYIDVSSSSLSLLIALFSVIGLSFSMIRTSLTPNNSNMSAEFRMYGGDSNKSILYRITNDGARIGEIFSMSLAITTRNSGTESTNTLQMYTPGDVLLAPGEMTITAWFPLIKPDDHETIAKILSKNIIQCNVQLKLIEFNEEEKNFNSVIDNRECKEVLVSNFNP